MSVILKTTLLKHWHYKEKFDADHSYGGYHHHHHHHHKHHYCFRVEKPILSICLSSELLLSILLSSIFINLSSFSSPFSFLLLLFCAVLVLFYCYFFGGWGGWWGVAHKFGIFVRTVLWPLAPYFFSRVTRKS